MTDVRTVRRILPICNKCKYSIESEYFEDGCAECCRPHIVSIEFLIDCLINSEFIDLNRQHISKRCPNYNEIMRILEK